MKGLLILVLSFIPASAISADIFTPYSFTYSSVAPDAIHIQGAACIDQQCSNIDENSQIEAYVGAGFESCFDDYLVSNDGNVFYGCIEQYKISQNILAVRTEEDFVVIRSSDKYPSGYLIQFFAKGRGYIPVQDRVSYKSSCTGDFCVDTNNGNTYGISFGRLLEVNPEIGTLNIIYPDNLTHPVQLDVPIHIDLEICSAYKLSNPYQHHFNPLEGYSDFSVDTEVRLEVTDDSGGQLYSDTVIVPIEADNCVALSTFLWAPGESMQNREVTFSVEAEVVDNQVIKSRVDRKQITTIVNRRD